MSTILTIECPACATAFPVDPDKVPAGGARTECTVCHTPFRVDDPAGEAAHEAVPEAWEDAGDDVDAGSIEAIVTAEDVVVDEVLTVWDAEAPPADDTVEVTEGMWEAGDEASEDRAREAADDEAGMYGGDGSDDVAAEADDDLPGEFDGRGASVEDVEPETTEPEDVAAAPEEELDTQKEREASVDEEVSETLDGLGRREGAGSMEDDTSPLADGIVTDQWSDLVSEGMEEAGDGVDADGWGGDDDDEGWVLETEDGEVTLSDLDLDVERLDTVEDQVRAAQEEPGRADPSDADFVEDAEVVADVGQDLLGGNEVVLPENALEVEGGIAEVGEAETAETPSAGEAEPAGADEAPGGGKESEEVFQFGRRDPHDKARRLARVLVSDMITYNPERHEEALAQNRLKEDFEEEIDKSWAEYVEQVGPEIAESTDYWRDALNDILARGEPLF